MTTRRAWYVLAVFLLSAGLLVQWTLLSHLAPANLEAYPHLVRPFAELSLTLKTQETETSPQAALSIWNGVDRPDLDNLRAILPFQVDDLLSRVYQLSGTDLAATLYLVHSRVGDDRKHHPEICIREVTGAPEDVRSRRTFGLAGDASRPVQRFRFKTGTQQYTTVYYWHYTFEPDPSATHSRLQQIHLRLGYPAPSVTVQVATLAPLDKLDPIEQSLLPLLDGSLAKRHLPPSRLACDRMPITLIRH
jgi:hypothetical protein